MSAGKRIAHSTGVLAVSTGVSRGLGFVRDLFLAHLFGTGVQSEAFVVAFRLPNLLRDLVAEGAVTSAFVPVLSWYRAKGRTEEFWGLSHTLLARLFVLLCGLGLAGSLAAPVIVRLIAPGFVEQPELFELTVRLTRILFPFVILVGLWAYFMGLLNSLRHFAVPALGPAILNVAMIAACVWFVPIVEPGVLALTVGVIIGGVVQLLVQLPVAMRLGFRFRFRWSHPGSREVLGLLGPRILGAAVYQASVLIHTALASLSAVVGSGAVAALYFANRLVQLPLALFGTASAQASLPSLSEQAARGELDRFRSTLISVVRMIGFVMLPASAGLMVLAFPIIGGLFERGAFDHRSTVMTAQALICYSLGLMAYSISKVLTGAFYALKDTWTPVRLAGEAVTVNILLSVALMWPLQVSGLALGAAGANTLNAYRLIRRMEARLNAPLLAPLLAPLVRIFVASVLMGAGCWVLWRFGLERQPAWLALPLVVTAGMVVYLGVCSLLRVPELSTVIRWLNSLPPLQRFAGK
jgi:putative peptidoglycan lipid II flippase